MYTPFLRLVRLMISILLLAAAVLNAVPASAGTATTVRLQPETGSFFTGTRFTVQVRIENVTDLYGVDVKLSFDPALLKVIDADANLAGVQNAPLSGFLVPGFVVRNEADNSAGTAWYAVTQLNPALPATGSGAVLAITFEALAPGSATAAFTKVQMSTRTAVDIPAVSTDSVYQLIVGQKIYMPVLVNP